MYFVNNTVQKSVILRLSDRLSVIDREILDIHSSYYIFARIRAEEDIKPYDIGYAVICARIVAYVIEDEHAVNVDVKHEGRAARIRRMIFEYEGEGRRVCGDPSIKRDAADIDRTVLGYVHEV